MISKNLINKILIYLIFIFIGFNLKIMKGIYIFDILILLFISFNYKYLLINKNLIITFSLLLIMYLLTNLNQVFFNNWITLESIRVFWVSICFIFFYIFFKNLYSKEIVLNYNLIYFLLSVPVILSVIMFFFPNIEKIILSFYGFHKYPAFGRYGGFFGSDVNTLGIYSSLILLLGMIFSKFNLVHKWILFSILVLAVFDIVLSGMRTGLIVFFGLLFIFNKKLNILNYKYIFLSLILIITTLFFIYIINPDLQILIDYIIKRFSIYKLLTDFGLTDSSISGGNLHTAINYFYRILDGREINYYNFFLGIDYNLDYVDNFYIYLFIKNGLLTNIFYIGFLVFLIFQFYKDKNFMGMYLSIVTLIIGIKGTFVIYQLYIVLLMFILYVWSINIKVQGNKLCKS